MRANGIGGAAVYVAFGRGLGSMDGTNVIDVHGAGAQRSDPKDGDSSSYPRWGNGPQGDVQRVFNYVRLVRDGTSGDVFTGGTVEQKASSPAGGEFGGANQGGQPQEAIDACVGLAAGAACTVETPNGNLSGSCTAVPSSELACVPEGGPPNGGQRP